MTTTTAPSDKTLAKIIALRDRARHANTPAAEAETALTLARKLCDKHGVNPSILDAKPEPQRVADPYTGGTFQKRYPCRFGCGQYVTHTIEELNECAARNRDKNGASGYAANQQRQADPFEDIFRDFFRTGSNSARSSSSSGSTRTRANGRESQARTFGPHYYCTHPATKSARAKCRKERGY